MKDLVARQPVLDAFKERTRKNLRGHRLDVMNTAERDSLTETVVISGGGAATRSPAGRTRTGRLTTRK
jgi:hypothetical protein